MNQDQKKEIQEKYYQEKQHGVKFWPDIIFKDVLVSFAIFLLLVGLATFIGVANEPPADPNDAAYIPRPEWYFLFLFQMLKLFPGKLEWIGAVVIPTVVVGLLLLLPFYDRSPFRYWKKRIFAIVVVSLGTLGIIALTIWAVVTTPPQEQVVVAGSISERISQGEDLFAINCSNCHGTEGEGGEIKGVEGLEGKVLPPVNIHDVMYAFTDETFHNIIELGQPEQGMPPFGKAQGGELSKDEMDSIVTFMRYTWDDRVEKPAGAGTGQLVPPLGPNEVPSYEVHVEPLVKRYCVTCHRSGKKNNNYLMGSYDEVMNSGDDAPNVKPFDLNSNIILMLNRETIDAGGPMPPSKPLKPEYIEIFTRWVAGGAPNTAADAAKATLPALTPLPGADATPTPTP